MTTCWKGYHDISPIQGLTVYTILPKQLQVAMLPAEVTTSSAPSHSEGFFFSIILHRESSHCV